MFNILLNFSFLSAFYYEIVVKEKLKLAAV